MSENYRNQQADGTFVDTKNLMAALTDVVGKTTVELEDVPFPRPGTYHVTVQDVEEDDRNLCARLRCNIDEGPKDLVGRNFVTTLWFNNENAIKWSMRTILRAATGQRFPKGEYAMPHILAMMEDMKNTQFVLLRTTKQGRDRTFTNDAFLSLDEWSKSKPAVPQSEPEPDVDDVAAKLAK